MKKLASLIVLVLSLSCVALAADWPQFCGPARDGKSPETGLIHAFPADGPKVVWTVRLNEGFGSAAIVDGELYVIDHEGANDQIRCFDAATGQEKWKCEYEAPGKVDFKGSRGVPAVTDKYVIAVGPFGHAACVDRKTHEKVWLVNVLTDFGGKTPVWDYQHVYDFLSGPQNYISGTKMSFVGLKQRQDRLNLIAWLRQQSSSPAAIPAPSAKPAAAAAAAPAADAAKAETPTDTAKAETPAETQPADPADKPKSI